MKKLIDIPDRHIEDLKKIAKSKRQSVKAYMELSVIAAMFMDLPKLKKK